MTAAADVSTPTMVVRDAVKIYGSGPTAVHALAGVSVEIHPGTFTAIMGPSGSGKSTLLHCMAGLDRTTRGDILLGNQEIGMLDDTTLTRLRRDNVGFIFQAYNLVPTLNARENITLPLDLAGEEVDQAWFDQVVDVLGIADRLTHKPSELSGGQQQRVAAARALVARPTIIFADEPTGALDRHSGTELLAFLKRATREYGQTIVMVTHDPSAASFADKLLFLADGKVVEEMVDPTSDAILERMKSLESGAED